MAPSLLTCCVFILFTFLFLQFSEQAPLFPGLKYLARFGYLDSQFLNPKSSMFLSEETLKTAVERFQAFTGIQVTGVLDEDTLAMMERPRCGVADFPRNEFAWSLTDLAYKISNYSWSLPRNKVDDEIQKAFEIWSRVIPLTFTDITSRPFDIDPRFGSGEHGDEDIDVGFSSGEHGDEEPFDGPGGIFGHSYHSFQTDKTKIHFDNSEKWTDNNSYRGINLFQAAAHEIGHALGLSHSDNKAAVMHPFYEGCESAFELNEDDVKAVQAKYGKNMSPNRTVPSTPSTCKEEPSTKDETNGQGGDDLCNENGIDTIFNTADRIVYVFKGSKYWRLTDDAVDAGYPKLISQGWPGLPGNIDAAFTYKNGKTYFFKGSQYWKYNGSKMDGRYPKKISEGFPGVPDNIDAATVWGVKGDIYFFKGSKYWCYVPYFTPKPYVSKDYPMPISYWKGVPNDLDAAIKYNNGYTYFFKKDKYYGYNDRSELVDVPPFPRPIGYWWFNCIESNK